MAASENPFAPAGALERVSLTFPMACAMGYSLTPLPGLWRIEFIQIRKFKV